jgi:hypothetical protein
MGLPHHSSEASRFFISDDPLTSRPSHPQTKAKAAAFKVFALLFAISSLAVVTATAAADTKLVGQQKVSVDTTEQQGEADGSSHTSTTREVTNIVADDTTNSAISITSTSSSSSSNPLEPAISMTVNGQSVAVPQNGTSQQTITTDGGSTSVSISSRQSTEGGQHASNSTTTRSHNAQVNSSSSITIDTHKGSP